MTCSANQWTGFYMITGSVMKDLGKNSKWSRVYFMQGWAVIARHTQEKEEKIGRKAYIEDKDNKRLFFLGLK